LKEKYDKLEDDYTKLEKKYNAEFERNQKRGTELLEIPCEAPAKAEHIDHHVINNLKDHYAGISGITPKAVENGTAE